jgi:hypothetical protein
MKFKRLTADQKKKIKQVLPFYVKSKPDIQFRKNPLTWLNGQCWNDEVETPTVNQSNAIATQSEIDEFDWDNVGLGTVLPNGSVVTADVVHIHKSTGVSYRKMAGL